MTYTFVRERPLAAARMPGPLTRFVGWLRAQRARRQRHIALAELLDYEDHRLDDLGVTRADVLEAIRHPATSAGRGLALRREARSRTVPSGAVTSILYEACPRR